MRMKRPGRSFLAHWLSGEKLSCLYEGTGTMIVCAVPYWRQRMQKLREEGDEVVVD